VTDWLTNDHLELVQRFHLNRQREGYRQAAVMPAASAVRTASAVGADIATMMGTPIVAAF
jgi:hypothetical protein